jgi:hypothetical protein
MFLWILKDFQESIICFFKSLICFLGLLGAKAARFIAQGLELRSRPYKEPTAP